MSCEFRRTLETPIGRLLLVATEQGLAQIGFHCLDVENDAHPLLLQAERQLQEYFAGRRRRFSVPLSINGSDFQKKVWQALREIPYGETRSYLDIARRIEQPKACRAVGQANHANPLPILLPCHRVIGRDGRLGGYAGGTAEKQFLLELERKYAEV